MRVKPIPALLLCSPFLFSAVLQLNFYIILDFSDAFITNLNITVYSSENTVGTSHVDLGVDDMHPESPDLFPESDQSYSDDETGRGGDRTYHQTSHGRCTVNNSGHTRGRGRRRGRGRGTSSATRSVVQRQAMVQGRRKVIRSTKSYVDHDSQSANPLVPFQPSRTPGLHDIGRITCGSG